MRVENVNKHLWVMTKSLYTVPIAYYTTASVGKVFLHWLHYIYYNIAIETITELNKHRKY